MQLTNEELKIAKQKYQSQIYNVEGKNRVDLNGNLIEMRLTFEEWLDIWLQSGQWNNRGVHNGQYVMSRIGDIGHYEIGNVEIKTARENNIEKCQSEKWLNSRTTMVETAEYQQSLKNRSSNPNWLAGIEKSANNRRKPISCDGVIYPSKGAAAIAVAPPYITDKTDWLHKRIKKYPDRYFYI